jgi:hypothetical protein
LPQFLCEDDCLSLTDIETVGFRMHFDPLAVPYSFNDEPTPARRGNGFRARFSPSCNNDLVVNRLRNENVPEQLRKEI